MSGGKKSPALSSRPQSPLSDGVLVLSDSVFIDRKAGGQRVEGENAW